MKRKYRLWTAILLMLLLTACAQAEPVSSDPPPQEDWPPFSGQIVFDDSVPEGTRMPIVTVFMRITEHSRKEALHLVPEADGTFTFERPGEVIDIYLNGDNLPDGVGVVLETVERDFTLEDSSGEFVLSSVASAEMSMDEDDILLHRDPSIQLFNAAGQELSVWDWNYDIVGRWLDEEKDLVEISGVATIGSAGSFSLSCTVKVPPLNAKERAELLDFWGVTDGVGFDGYAANGADCTRSYADFE